jgi:phospholipid transport system substrate-binding protein|tara:strand:+ start:347 stop:967 length:621 start_codon:yes stop_codon:yes gene_type:complete
MITKWLGLSLVLMLVGMTTWVHGTPPMETLQKPMNEIVRILKDPQYREKDKKEVQREELWKIIRGIFDFREMSKRSLARNWKRFNSGQRDQFTDVFSTLLGNIYLNKVQGEYHDERVVYLSEAIIKDKKAIVKTEIVRENGKIPMNYHLRLHGKKWKIYDVIIEGVGLVKNYRTQFKKILRKVSPDQLIERLKKKNEAQQKKTAQQ